MEYICLNPQCENYQKSEYLSSESYQYIGGKLMGKNCPCPKCGQLRKENNPDAEIPLSEKGITFNFFSGMSMEQKRKVLKERSKQDFQKHIKERKDGLLNQAITEMKEINKR